MKITYELDTELPGDLYALAALSRALDQITTAPDETPAAVVPPPPAAPAPDVAAVPPVPPAPTPAVAVVPPPWAPFSPTIAAPTFDKDGMPWDGRIHSSSKAFLADGTWRQRRNTDPAVVAAVTAELRAAIAAPAAPAAPVDPVDWTASLVPPPPPVDAPMTFPMFMKAITAARTPPATVLAACTAVGVPNIPALMSRPDLIPQVAATLGVAP